MGQLTVLVAALLALGQGGDLVHASPRPKVAEATSVGFMADVGISPIPTNPPELPEGLPRELAPRAESAEIPYPPPGFYCGLVNGDPATPLTCIDARYNCIHKGKTVGCCASKDPADCSLIPTTCLNWNGECDDKCQKDSRVLRCTARSTLPYCETYDFGGGTKLYNCREIESQSWQVQSMSDYFSSALGPDYTTLATKDTTSDGFSLTETDSSDSYTLSNEPTSTTIEDGQNTHGAQQGGSDTATPDNSGSGSDGGGGGGLSGGAIAGIVIGVVAVVGGVGAFIAWLLIVKRKQNNNAAAAAAAASQPPPAPPVAQVNDPNHPPLQPGGGGVGHYAPAEGKEPPSYATYDANNANTLIPPAPNGPGSIPPGSPGHTSPVPEMPGTQMPPGSPGSQQPPSPQPYQVTPEPREADNGATPQTQPQHPLNPQMAPTHVGPVPDQVYEMGTTR